MTRHKATGRLQRSAPAHAVPGGESSNVPAPGATPSTSPRTDPSTTPDGAAADLDQQVFHDGDQASEAQGRGVPRTRAGAAWVGLASAALLVVALVVFMLQNTQRVDVSFLWMTGRTSLGLVLLIAVLGAVVLTLALGTVRILQLRRLVRRDRRN
ncbi:LapA family protein [Nocardioides albidus]|uniref:LapA family protein n=1 Tax=Nocardioides albidus TaxID=1517589 RepID=A0A5C4VNT8_9ACTN|nr:LapA family protein [Nocardioides albidus]TNM37498.1 LapA family protein [Nocardioides albidus]